MKVNINGRVIVRLTKDGEKIYRQYRKQSGIKPYSPEKDERGRIKLQLLELMNIFGHEIGICKPPPFMDNVIEFSSKKT